MSRAQAALKRLVVGRPMSHGELEHTLLPKLLALPVFSSDPLSSVSYATQEILLVLGLAGAGALTAAALGWVVPVSLAVAGLLIIVVTSYRHTVRAYPRGGGAFIVSYENLGTIPGLMAGSALLIDYVLTVAVSVVAGVEAITSAAPGLYDNRVPIALGFVLLVTVANLRGAKESGIFFAVPTYGFVACIYLLLIAGFFDCVVGGCTQAESAHLVLPHEEAFGWFLVLRAFAAGTTALTGVEAISDGVAAFRYPQSKNAAATLAIMGTLSVSMFLGISMLAHATGVRYEEGAERSVVAQIAHAVFGGGPLFYVLQVATAAILILAANTAYQDFPRLSSILAREKFMPRQLMIRGDRLVFSNGVVILALLASLLIIVFDAELTRLIQLYLVGVFVSFTLSQTGMVVRWRRLKEPGWQRNQFIQGFGALVTGIVLIVVVTTKFLHGAWIVVAAQPILMYLMLSIRTHYQDVARQLEDEARRPTDRRPGNQHVVLFVHTIDEALARAVGYARSIRPADITAVALDGSQREAWSRIAPDIPLEVAARNGSLSRSIREYLRAKRAEYSGEDFLTFVLPELLKKRSLMEVIQHPRLHQLKATLLLERGVQVLDVPVLEDGGEVTETRIVEPAINHVTVLVSGLHNATLQAIEYAETLQTADIRCLSIGLDPEQTESLTNLWLDAGIDLPLEIEDSPFRDIGWSLKQYVRGLQPDGITTVVTVVIPEFVVSKRRHQLLHGQTALIVKRHLLFEPGVVVASVPYYLEVQGERSPTGRAGPGAPK